MNVITLEVVTFFFALATKFFSKQEKFTATLPSNQKISCRGTRVNTGALAPNPCLANTFQRQGCD